jgi:hypothetical protein
MSSDEDSQLQEAADFLAVRWSDVLDEEPVAELRSALSSSSWTAESFDVLDVRVDNRVRVHFSFDAKGLDRRSKASGDRIHGTAVAVIDEYDTVKYVDIEVG